MSGWLHKSSNSKGNGYELRDNQGRLRAMITQKHEPFAVYLIIVREPSSDITQPPYKFLTLESVHAAKIAGSLLTGIK